MTPDPLLIPAGEQGRVRLFSLTPELGRLAQMATGAPTGDGAALLGHPNLDAAHIDLVRLADLGDLGLDGYLTEGHDIPPAAMAAALPRLAGLTGHVLIVRSAALPAGGRLAPVAGVAFIAAFAQADPDPARLWPGTPPAESAAPAPVARAVPRPARGVLPAGRLVALAAGLLVLGLLFVWLR